MKFDSSLPSLFRRASISALAALTLLPVAANGEEQAREITLMPLGDSITEIPASYRYPLMHQLREEGYRVRYVGSKTSYANPEFPQMEKLAHESYGGKTVQFLAENIATFYTKNPADIILLHAGHNQFADQKPIPGVIAATREIIAYVQSVNPKVTVLLAQVITAGKLPKYSYIPELNEELAKLAAEMDRPEQRVIIVNQADGFDWKVDTVKDMVHPNPAGGRKMAAKWHEALVPLLPPPAK